MRLLLIGCCSLLVLNNCFAMQLKELSPYQKVNIVVSDYEFNRIAVENDRISNVFAMKDHFHIETDEQNGQIFVEVKDQTSSDVASLSIVTEKGVTQDITLIAKHIPAETILFKSSSTGLGKDGINVNGEIKELHNENEQMTALIKSMIQSQRLEGYQIRHRYDAVDQFIGQVTIKLTKVYQGNFIGEVYQVTNSSDKPLVLVEQDFYNSNKIKMILLGNRNLGIGEKCYLYVVNYV
jgi:type-F conjugative transfer system secretin TraK